LVLSKGANRVGIFLPSPEEGNNPVSETLVFSSFQNTGGWIKFISRVILIQEEITRLSSKYSAALNTHPNHLVTELSNPPAFRRLRKLPPSDLPYRFTENTQILTTVIKYYF
jgi:hypothetical protein